MGLFDGLGTAIVGGVSKYFGAKSQQKAEKEAQEKQNKFNQNQALLQNKFDLDMANHTYGQNKEMAEYQYSKDLEQWNRANEYDTPESQMQRLEEAGLNPNLVYGNGATATSSASLPKYQAPTADFSRVSAPSVANISQVPDFNFSSVTDGILAYLDTKMKAAQIDSINAQTKNNVATTLLTKTKQHGETSRSNLSFYKEQELRDKLYGKNDSYGTQGYSFQSNQLQVDKMINEAKRTKYSIEAAKLQNALKTKAIDWHTYQKLLDGIGTVSRFFGSASQFIKPGRSSSYSNVPGEFRGY